MDPQNELGMVLNVSIPLSKLSEKFGRPIIDFSRFVDVYRAAYTDEPRLGIYAHIEKNFGRKALDLLNKLS